MLLLLLLLPEAVLMPLMAAALRAGRRHWGRCLLAKNEQNVCCRCK